ncbi:hypothetical protein Moror_17145 [Moniliophthora roreri MCA 2997]|uniref:F-box domain-containing protein n=2 Tax=Moniliophthora roreri TaxID=221103 RepID=V2X4M8_MONRO|nr:hypothetical protein Moror_17145 [Moniliophthora roreri MCA 2997]
MSLLTLDKHLQETTVELCDQCHLSYPSFSSPLLAEAGKYLVQHADNETPLDHEIPYLSEALRGARAELEGCRLELRKTRDVVHKLEERQRCLQDMTERLRGMVEFSIRRLPPEVLSRVFVIAQQERDESWSSCQVPLTLGQVCSQWRAITHSDPRLWSYIQVNFRVDDDKLAAHKILEWTKLCLKKSLPKPIQIDFTTPDPDDCEGEDGECCYQGELHWPVLAEFLSNCDKWEAADLILWPCDRIIFPHPMPMLESLFIDVQTTAMTFWNPPTRTESLSAPRLSYLRLGGLECKVLKQVDLNTLTRLTMEDYHTDTLFHILKHSSNLREVEVMGERNELLHYQHEYGSPVTSQLQTLKTAFSYSMGDFFHPCLLPEHVFTPCHGVHGERWIQTGKYPNSPIHLTFFTSLN